MLMTRQDILLQNQRDNMAFNDFTLAMRELLISEMEADRMQQVEVRSSAETYTVITVQAA